MKYYPEIRHKPPSILIRKFEGADKRDAFLINNTLSSELKNMNGAVAPTLTTRPGFSVLGSAIGTKVLGLGVWKDTELHAVFDDGTWRKWTGSAWSAALKSGLSTTATWSFCNFHGNLSGISLIGSNGVDSIQYYDGSTVQDLPTAPADGNYIDTHDNRLFCAVGARIYFSPIAIADNWNLVLETDADGGYADKEAGGELICGLKAGNNHLTVFFPNSSHELYGSNPSDIGFQPVADDIGGLNNQSIVIHEGIMYFADETGAYMYTGGVRPRKDFSQPVQWYFDRINTSAKDKACLGARGRSVYFALPITSSSAPDTILEYDTVARAWYVWEDIAALHFARMGDALYIGDAAGRVLQIGGTTDNGTAINWKWVSKVFTSSSSAKFIRWTRLWIVADMDTGSALNAYVSPSPDGDSSWVYAGGMTATAQLQSTSIPIIPATMANSNWLRLKLEGSGVVTIREISIDEMDLPIR